MTILGGIGTLSGSILGAALMHILSQFFYQWFGARWPLVFGIIFILIVLFLPYGIVGTYRMKKYDIKNGWNRFIKLFKSNDG
jgi:ABC-type branched-subunit amino acid transport system permease subunit